MYKNQLPSIAEETVLASIVTVRVSLPPPACLRAAAVAQYWRHCQCASRIPISSPRNVRHSPSSERSATASLSASGSFASTSCAR